ncbi:MAG: hypothetical protein WC813_03680 [Patescibacteria group bacterium]|jgi:hypothetical protein
MSLTNLIVAYPFGLIGCGLSLLYTVYGIPVQMYRIWKVKSVKEIPASPQWIGLTIAFHIGIQQYLQGNDGLATAMLANFIGTGLVLCQIRYYR